VQRRLALVADLDQGVTAPRADDRAGLVDAEEADAVLMPVEHPRAVAVLRLGRAREQEATRPSEPDRFYTAQDLVISEKVHNPKATMKTL
jgi:hypothetical protein